LTLGARDVSPVVVAEERRFRTSPDLHADLGEHAVLYGTNAVSSSLVMWDRFTCDNHNSVILTRSEAGKSYLAKLDVLRSLFTGVEVCVIDPENEYQRLCTAVGGAHIALGADGVRLNPFDLPPGASRTKDALTRRALFIHTFIAVLLETPLSRPNAPRSTAGSSRPTTKQA
jgi:hypothetical protein